MFSTMPNAISFTFAHPSFLLHLCDTLKLSFDCQSQRNAVHRRADIGPLRSEQHGISIPAAPPAFLPPTHLGVQSNYGTPFPHLYSRCLLVRLLNPFSVGSWMLLLILMTIRCFAGITPPSTGNDCSSNPYPYLIYIGINIIFNLLILMITKRASALLGCDQCLCWPWIPWQHQHNILLRFRFMAIKAVLPISILLFFFNWYLLILFSICTFLELILCSILIGLLLGVPP